MTFQIIGDNVDVHQKPRYMTADHKSRDYHWFHIYAVKNRVNVGEHIYISHLYIYIDSVYSVYSVTDWGHHSARKHRCSTRHCSWSLARSRDLTLQLGVMDSVLILV